MHLVRSSAHVVFSLVGGDVSFVALAVGRLAPRLVVFSFGAFFSSFKSPFPSASFCYFFYIFAACDFALVAGFSRVSVCPRLPL